MIDIVLSLKTHARVFHRKVQSGDAGARARARAHDEFRHAGDAALSSGIRRRHCLAVIAGEIGFDGWSHALQVLQGGNTGDFGTLLYPGRCGAHANIWCASHDEASHIHAEHGGYLLAYRKQFLVVDEHFIRTLGLDPDDPDWRRMGQDWVKPKDAGARKNLYGKLVRAALEF